MILDERAKFSEAQAITVAADSTRSYDLGAMGVTHSGAQLVRNIDKLAMIALLVKVTTTFGTAAGMTDLEIIVEEASDAAFTADLKDVLTVTVPIAQLVAGFVVPGFESIPRGISQRYFQFKYAPVGGAANAGAITAQVVAANDGSYKG